MTTDHPLVLIAAVARNGVIGRAGAMPWHLPGDLAHFRDETAGRPLLMGRRTFAAIGRPLPGRSCVVVSADPEFTPVGVVLARSLEEGLALADQEARRIGTDRIMVGGGGMLYRALIGQADALVITAVDADPAGDTEFPAIDPAVWQLVGRNWPPRRPDDTAPYTIERWARRHPPWRAERESGVEP